MADVMPAKVQVWYKLRTDPIERLRRGPDELAPPVAGSPVTPSGVSSTVTWRERFLAEGEIFDIFLRQVNEAGHGPIVAFKETGHNTTLFSQIDSTTKTIKLRAEHGFTANEFINITDTIRIEDELLTVTGRTDVGDYWQIEVSERAAHGTAAAGHNSGVDVHVIRYTVPMIPVLADDQPDLLTAPQNVVARGVEGGIQLSWEWEQHATDIEKSFLAGFRIFASISSPVGYDDVALNGTKVQGENYKFIPYSGTVAGAIDNTNTYYIKIAAVDVLGYNGTLSSEVSAKVSHVDSPDGGDKGPPEAAVYLEPQSSATLAIRVKHDTSVNPTEAHTTVKSADIELYFGSNVDNESVTPSDTQVYSGSDSLFPYEHFEILTDVGNYWARARFVDVNDTEGDWGVSDVTPINPDFFTPDTGLVDPATIILDGDATGLYADGVLVRISILAGVGSLTNTESATKGEMAFCATIDGEPPSNFDPTPIVDANGNLYSPFSGSNTTGHLRTIQNYGNSHYYGAAVGYRYWLSGAIKNAYGWCAWADYEEIPVSLDLPPSDVNLPEVDQFVVYTSDDTIPDAEVLAGNRLRFDVGLGKNSATVFGYRIYGHTSATPPSQVTLIDQDTSGGTTATMTTGVKRISISGGYSASVGEFDRKTFVQGRNVGLNVEGQPTKEYNILEQIGSGTSFELVINVSASGQPINGNLTYWSIVSALPRNQVQYYRGGNVDVRDGSMVPEFDYSLHHVYEFGIPSSDLYYSIRVINPWGWSSYRYHDGSIIGTLTSGSAAKVLVPKVKQSEQTPGTVPPISDSTFSVTDHDTLAWTAGDILVGGVAFSFGASNTGNLTDNVTYYVYGLLDVVAETATISWSLTFSDAIGDDKAFLGMFITTSDTSEEGSWITKTSLYWRVDFWYYYKCAY
jgi:hypothetical protein